MNYIIGCGGVGSAIVPSFCLLKAPADITLIDGDTIETKNLNRQMFDARQVGQNKAQALSAKYSCRFIPEWFARGKIRHQKHDWLLCLVDNHRTRLEALEVCDEAGCQAIFAANETHSAEAYYYRRTWLGTNRDPRVYYPELKSDRSGDPRATAIGCTGEAGMCGAMSAAGIAEMVGADPQQVEDAASLTLQAFTGMPCDPMPGGSCQPCRSRVIAATCMAHVFADLALAGHAAVLPLHEAIDVADAVGRALPPSLLCTSEGGACAAPTALTLREEFRRWFDETPPQERPPGSLI